MVSLMYDATKIISLKVAFFFQFHGNMPIHDYDAMFHVHDELEQSLLWDQFNLSPCYNVNLVSGSCMGMDGGTTSVVNS